MTVLGAHRQGMLLKHDPGRLRAQAFLPGSAKSLAFLPFRFTFTHSQIHPAKWGIPFTQRHTNATFLEVPRRVAVWVGECCLCFLLLPLRYVPTVFRCSRLGSNWCLVVVCSSKVIYIWGRSSVCLSFLGAIGGRIVRIGNRSM